MIERLKMYNEEIFIVNIKGSLQIIPISQLIYMETSNRLVIYHLITGRLIKSTQSFTKSCDVLLKYPYFIKPHRSYVVNMNYINSITNTEILLQNQVKIPIPRRQAKEIKETYIDYQMEG